MWVSRNIYTVMVLYLVSLSPSSFGTGAHHGNQLADEQRCRGGGRRLHLTLARDDSNIRQEQHFPSRQSQVVSMGEKREIATVEEGIAWLRIMHSADASALAICYTQWRQVSTHTATRAGYLGLDNRKRRKPQCGCFARICPALDHSRRRSNQHATSSAE